MSSNKRLGMRHVFIGFSIWQNRTVFSVDVSDPRSMSRPPGRLAHGGVDMGLDDLRGLTPQEATDTLLSWLCVALDLSSLTGALAGGPGAPGGATGARMPGQLELVLDED